ncbi:hypothetical protein IGI04_035082 [Brassica rapa subsp. trilocularis]|uniref:Uncharacterized protein n=1 Tax=Brassica rapa subsp. trilocularis TaxID=1813537 RepID=A0ABQ7LAL2_BRACM|nr:hypothetical protein IGI04_035082 [Brassica rapa subsp. trilocularis]
MGHFFDIKGAWKRLLCAKQVISLKLVFKLTFKCVFLDDLHGSRPSLRLTWRKSSIRRLTWKSSIRRLTQKFHHTIYTKVVLDFIQRFWSNLAYLGRLPYSIRKSDPDLKRLPRRLPRRLLINLPKSDPDMKNITHKVHIQVEDENHCFQIKEIRVGLKSFSLEKRYKLYATEDYQMKKNQT